MQNGRPVRRIRPSRPSVDAETVGALAMHFMLETAIAGYMLGIDPYTQPAVDAGKALMRDRKLLTLDEAEIAARSRERAQETWERFWQ